MIDDETVSNGNLAMTGLEGSTAMTGGSLAGASVNRAASKSSGGGQNGSAGATFPPPKTDKPRPHVCTTCTRSFARLEHLKRHERSHTKEKPFECPECSRCFARRDLLLRHQQKLHSTTTPSSRPRSGRRESNAGSGRVRKNSNANNVANGMRPRANTLSHLDANTLEMLATSSNLGRNGSTGHGHRISDSSLSGVSVYPYRGFPNTQPGSLHSLPRLNTSALPSEHTGGLRTAPVYGGYSNELSMSAFTFGAGNTINPNQLHIGEIQGFAMDDPSLQHPYSGSANLPMSPDGEPLGWRTQGFVSQPWFNQINDSAIEPSSPSVMDTNSPDRGSDGMLDANMSAMNSFAVSAPQMWHAPVVPSAQMIPSPINLDFSSTFGDMVPAPQGTISPKSLLAQGGSLLDLNLPSPPPLHILDQAMPPGLPASGFQMPTGRTGGASTTSTSSLDSGLRQSSITTVSCDIINEHTRSSVLTSLWQYSGFGQRPYSQPHMSSPSSPAPSIGGMSLRLNDFPSTLDLQRYFAAYIQYFQPHLPFLHIPSLSFESSEYRIPSRMINRQSHSDHSSISGGGGGGGCLMLAITAIGALYEHDMTQSKQLFDAAKYLIGGVLEERRMANLGRTGFGPRHDAEGETTPLWLVQAMLLNVIYGYHCGDKTSADIASNHCATLVSLTRGAELARPYPGYMVMTNGTVNPDVQMNRPGSGGWSAMTTKADDATSWQEWKIVEERKRTLYAVFVLSSLLVSAYNHPPALLNSEIRLRLPCEEELWTAENASTWQSMGGAVMAEDQQVMFNAALGQLLTASQRVRCEAPTHDGPFRLGIRVEDLPQTNLKPSTFGCLILINALHNYIWETRRGHLGRQWTNQDTEMMYTNIEPALHAWQAAWAANPLHSLERPNPFGAGPLSADCIPLLDLAYVRLFVNFGCYKEALWQRDLETMADGLAWGAEPEHHLTHSASTSYEESHTSPATYDPSSQPGSAIEAPPGSANLPRVSSHGPLHLLSHSGMLQQPEKLASRERHLRKAAFYAADSLALSNPLSIGFAGPTSRGLPLHHAMCAFDCAQVVSEWVGIVQDRIGRYVGILGSAGVDNPPVANFVSLDDDDRKLMDKISNVLQRLESQMMPGSAGNPTNHGGYGSRILMSTARILESTAVWPVTSLMAQSLEIQASRMEQRALSSVTTQI